MVSNQQALALKLSFRQGRKIIGDVSSSTAPLGFAMEAAKKPCHSALLAELRLPSVEMGVHVQMPGDSERDPGAGALRQALRGLPSRIGTGQALCPQISPTVPRPALDILQTRRCGLLAHVPNSAQRGALSGSQCLKDYELVAMNMN